jgi:hypothetical protein
MIIIRKLRGIRPAVVKYGKGLDKFFLDLRISAFFFYKTIWLPWS